MKLIEAVSAFVLAAAIFGLSCTFGGEWISQVFWGPENHSLFWRALVLVVAVWLGAWLIGPRDEDLWIFILFGLGLILGSAVGVWNVQRALPEVGDDLANLRALKTIVGGLGAYLAGFALRFLIHVLTYGHSETADQ